MTACSLFIIKGGCTFCTVCCQNYLKRFKYCPIDNSKLEWKQCSKASPALRKILDKLLVVCPNLDYCEGIFCKKHKNMQKFKQIYLKEVLQRHELEFHLQTK